MKKLIPMFLLFWSWNVLASECSGEQKGLDTPFSKHIELASEIYMGKVINSYLVEEIHKIVFEIKASELFKGRYQNHITLFSTSYSINPEISIGKNYIIFLYGDKNVNFCGVTIDIGDADSLDRLKDYVNNNIFEQRKSEQIKTLLASKASQP